MKAAVLIAAGQPLEIEQLSISKPQAHEVLIRTAACGLCHSDLHFIEGTYPHALPAVPGHEAAGIVEAVGSEVTTVKVGDAVVGHIGSVKGSLALALVRLDRISEAVDKKQAVTSGGITIGIDPMPVARYNQSVADKPVIDL